MSKLNVILTGHYYPMAILRYYEAALQRRDDVNLVTAGPYYGNMIPWNNWMALPQKYATPPTITLPQGMTTAPVSFIESQLNVKPDLWLQIDAGFHLEGRPQNGKNVVVATDPHVLNYDTQRGIADTFYCMQDCYKKEGDIYLPYAFDPVFHAPQEEERLFDVCLLGLHYPNRNLLVDRLRQNGVKVYYDLGPCFDEARKIYNQAPIGLNWSSKDDLVARVFELLGMRRLAVVNHVPDLPKFFKNGVDLIVFRSADEAVEKILYYLDNEDKGEAIAAQGHETVKPHTWDARIDQILGDL
jgi:hypothetical protein